MAGGHAGRTAVEILRRGLAASWALVVRPRVPVDARKDIDLIGLAINVARALGADSALDDLHQPLRLPRR